MEVRVTASALIVRAECVLLVQEADPRVAGLWSLPGGHIEDDETIIDCARRETLEETGLNVEITGLLGIYQYRIEIGTMMRFVFYACSNDSPGSCEADVSDMRWFALTEIDAMPDEALVRPAVMRRIVADFRAGKKHPVDIITNVSP